jgi:hypothetical protein
VSSPTLSAVCSASHVLVKGIVYPLELHHDIPEGFVGANRQQRIAFQINVNDTVQVTPITIDKTRLVSQAYISLTLITQSNTKYAIDYSDLVSLFKTQFSDFVGASLTVLLVLTLLH